MNKEQNKRKKITILIAVILTMIVATCVAFFFHYIKLLNTVSASLGSKNDIQIIGGNKQHLGSIKKNERRSYTFTIRNNSQEILQIESVKPSCGCFGGRSASKNTLSPGEIANIDIEIVGRASVGRIDGKNYINIKFIKHPPVLITFTYDVIQDVYLSPEQISLGQIYQKDIPSGSLLLRPLGWGVLQILHWESEKGIIFIDRLEEVNDGIRCYYTVKKLSPGKYNDTLVISSNAKIDSTLRIPFSWEVVPNLTLIPKSIFWGTLSPNNKKEKSFLIKSVDGNTFKVKSIKYDEFLFKLVPLFDLNIPTKEAKYNIIFKSDNISSKKIFRDSIVVETDKGSLILTMFGNIF